MDRALKGHHSGNTTDKSGTTCFSAAAFSISNAGEGPVDRNDTAGSSVVGLLDFGVPTSV